MKIRLMMPAVLLAALLLSGCGQQAASAPGTAGGASAQPPQSQSADSSAPQASPSQSAGSQNSTAEEPGREKTAVLEFSVEGQTEAVPVTLYSGEGYSIYIPDEGWRLERETDDGIPERTTVWTWESTVNDEVELEVRCYSGVSPEIARDRFLADRDDFVFEGLTGGGLGNPLYGSDAKDRETLAFMTAERGGDAYVVSWQYPDEAAEGFGARLAQIADTFALTQTAD